MSAIELRELAALRTTNLQLEDARATAERELEVKHAPGSALIICQEQTQCLEQVAALDTRVWVSWWGVTLS